MTDFKIALLGYGTAGAVFHAPLIAATPGLALAAIVTRSQAEAAHAAYPEAAIIDSAESLWARADAFDAVVIATPNATHVSLAHAAIEAGLAVIIDKPMAAHVADGLPQPALGQRFPDRGRSDRPRRAGRDTTL